MMWLRQLVAHVTGHCGTISVWECRACYRYSLSGVAQSLGQLVAHVTGYCGTISAWECSKVTDKAVVVWLSHLGSL